MAAETAGDVLGGGFSLGIHVEREVNNLELCQPLELGFDPCLFGATATTERHRKGRPAVIPGRHGIDLAFGDCRLARFGIERLPAEQDWLASGLYAGVLLALRSAVNP